MKNPFIIIIALLFLVCLYSCRHTKTDKQTIISGHIKNVQAFPGENQIIVEVVDFGGAPSRYAGSINKNGYFKIKINQLITEDIKLVQDFRTTPIINTFIAHPGDSVYLDLDYKSMNNITFSGDAQKANTDLYEYSTKYYSYADVPVTERQLPTLAAYKTDMDRLKATMERNRAEFIEKVKPDDEVKAWTRNYVNLTYYNALGDFLQKYNAVNSHTAALTLVGNNESLNKATSVALKDVVDFGDDLNNIYNKNVLNSSSYALLNYLTPVPGPAKSVESFDDKLSDRISAINKGNSNNDLLKQMLVGRVLYSSLLKNYPAGFDKNSNAFESEIHEPFIKKPLLNFYAKVKHNLADPNVTPNTKLHPTLASQPKTILDTIIAQNKGKVIYLDVWATWCKPCIAQMPITENYKTTYKGKNVAFVALGMGNKATWINMVADLKLTPNQYYCEVAQTKSLAAGIRLRAFPHFMVINKQGEIIANGNGFKPGDPLTTSTINKLLQN